jgi:hypothetical protein
MSSTPASSTNIKAEAPKTKWEKLLMYTPVVLTVLATLLAGMSTGEMTQAQYHRSLAAQNQSKAGDQWGFFQAKRIRGSSLDATADVIATLAEPGIIDVQRLMNFQTQLLADAERIHKDADRVAEAASKMKQSPMLAAAADELRQATQRIHESVGKSHAKLQAQLQAEETPRSITFMAAGTLPSVEDSAIQDEAIKDCATAVSKRRPERETEPLMKSVDAEVLARSIETAEGNAQRFDDVCKPVSRRLDALNRALAEQALLARSLDRAVIAFNAKLAEAGIANSSEVWKDAVSINDLAQRDKAQAAEIYADFLAARHRFTALRYERDAAYNGTIANLYEVQVRKSNWNSDRHLRRSRLFFFGMLAAQAGVTIASLALAVRMQSLLWGLASAAGFAAVAIAIVVYCFV